VAAKQGKLLTDENFIFMLPCIIIDFFLNNQQDALIIQISFCYKTLRVSGIFSAHHQEFSTVHSAMASFMQVFDDRFQAESGWN
jgi:predicted permease